MNLLKGKKKATYAKTGYWSQRAVNEALILCPEVEIAVEIEVADPEIKIERRKARLLRAASRALEGIRGYGLPALLR